MGSSDPCGAEHPEIPGLFCERSMCVEYHRNGGEIWTQGAQRMPSQRPDPERMLGVIRRTQAKARRSDPGTSHEAAASVSGLTEAQGAVYALLSERQRSDEQVYALLVAKDYPISPSGARTRRSELVDMGLVEDSGEHYLTGAGRKTIVWRVRK